MQGDGSASDTEALKVPPHDLEAEQAVLGGLMLDNAAWDQVADRLHEEDFYRREHRLVFRAMGELAEGNHPMDVVTLSGWLRQQGKLEEAGGLSYLGSIARETPSAANIRAYADIVRERSVLRQLIRAGSDVAEAAFRPEGRNSEDLLDYAEQTIFQIAEQTGRNRQGFVGMRQLMPQVIDRIDSLYRTQEPVTGLSTGFDDLDHLTSGLQNGDLIILAGRPSMGKCLSRDAEIVQADGSVVTIEQVVRERRGQVATLGEDLCWRWVEPSDYVDDGHKPVFEVVTRLGRRVETTLTHPFLTAAGWRPLETLRAGDAIAVPRRLPVFGEAPVRDCEIRLLGHLAGDGGLRPDPPWFTKAYPAIARDFLDALARWREDPPVLERAGGEDSTGIPEGMPGGANGPGLAVREPAPGALPAWLERLGMQGARGDARCLPQAAFRLPRGQVAMLLSRLFATNGWIANAVKGPGAVGLCSRSERLVRQVQHLLLRFGVLARVRRVLGSGFEGGRTVWQLKLEGADSLLIFVAQIGILGEEERLQGLVRTVQQYPAEEAHERGQEQGVPAGRDICWDRIESIRSLGCKQVYDLTIPQTHNFLANDVCVHNTTVAMNMVEHVAMRLQKPVAVFSMEMPADALAMRMLASLGRVPLQRVRSGKLEDDHWPRLTSTMSLLAEAPLFIDDSPGLTPTEIRARSRRLQREHDELGLIVIDYLQLMQIPGFRENRAGELSEISRGLKALAKELNTPVIALSQLNRSLEQRPNKRPIMSDLRECVTGETPVLLADGRRVPIERLVRTAPEVVALDEHHRPVSARAERVWRVGRRAVYEIAVSGGRSVRATAEHRLLTARGWQRVGALERGEALAVADRERPLAGGGVRWDEVVRIEPAGEAEVYDLTVPGPACWLADGIVSHNSGAIEQDADLIAFIYRDEVYNEETPDKGIAELIIAKQRQGPIGTVRLTFLGEYTRFENYAEDVYSGGIPG
ncbi:MAG: replicative DNA helicase [Halorhodospira sp.]